MKLELQYTYDLEVSYLLTTPGIPLCGMPGVVTPSTSGLSLVLDTVNHVDLDICQAEQHGNEVTFHCYVTTTEPLDTAQTPPATLFVDDIETPHQIKSIVLT
jgi:hypothetical protein